MNAPLGMQKFQVYIGALHVSDVFYVAGTSAREVRHGLIDHDGMPNTVSVYRLHAGDHAFDDMARATHPEEL